MTNTALLERVLAQIEAAPAQWDQGNYASQTDLANGECGTAYCFAGWAVALTYPAAKFAFTDTQSHWPTDRTATTVVLNPAEFTGPAVIDAVARDLLGISDKTAEVLFEGGNSLDDLRRMVADLVAGRPIDFDDEDGDQ
jgi:hypothetical protein